MIWILIAVFTGSALLFFILSKIKRNKAQEEALSTFTIYDTMRTMIGDVTAKIEKLKSEKVKLEELFKGHDNQLSTIEKTFGDKIEDLVSEQESFKQAVVLLESKFDALKKANDPAEESLLTVKQLSERYNLSTRTIYGWKDKYGLKHTYRKLPGSNKDGYIMINPQDLEEFINNRYDGNVSQGGHMERKQELLIILSNLITYMIKLSLAHRDDINFFGDNEYDEFRVSFELNYRSSREIIRIYSKEETELYPIYSSVNEAVDDIMETIEEGGYDEYAIIDMIDFITSRLIGTY